MEFYIGKIPRIRIGGTPLERAVVLKWFYSLSRRKTFVGGKCALPSALLLDSEKMDSFLRHSVIISTLVATISISIAVDF